MQVILFCMASLLALKMFRYVLSFWRARIAPGRAGLYLGIYLRHDERPWSIDVAGPVDAFRHRPQVQPVVR